ncbi:dTDP-4-dehydrorhamnose reductase [Sphingobacterium humi]|uniref:dTDP-4-dehydrorhamnose reductase n=1 Tax=Sphingobacterium humi TaxID=1796905 RepID=A0A6N8L3M5_9SPHI|nr:dTDP-4-dehydrorhamnose reductase [Sphingobacterium humi]MVZ63629.1 dTDP-4-dehydrorhamnose reductase [Sphingobacterium humi]
MNGNKRVVITGATGQLGQALKERAEGIPGFEFIFLDRQELPLENLEQVVRSLKSLQPHVLINTAAYTAVDLAEVEIELAERVNHLAVREMAAYAAQYDCKFMSISTDYVFDGSSSFPLDENQPTAPVNVYGRSKLNGEKAAFEVNAQSIIIRTSWVYSPFGKNFVNTMLQLMRTKDEISVVSDQHGSPTNAFDLADLLLNIIEKDLWIPGIYHYSNEGEASWFDFAIAIRQLTQLDCKVLPVNSDAFPTKAKRPKNSLLDKSKIKSTFDITIPHWKESLTKMLEQYPEL